LGGFDTPPETEADLPLEALSQMQIELILGHYGNEVAGLMKFKGQKPQKCGCILLQEGRYDSSSGAVSFYLRFSDQKSSEACSSQDPACEPLCKIDTINANLKNASGGLEGTCTITFKGIDQKMEKKMELKKTAELQNLPDEGLSCEGYDIRYPR
jgi:hypothetical protein